MNTTLRDRLQNRTRHARPVPIEGGDPLHVRPLTLAELRDVDRRAELLPSGAEREVRRVEWMAVFALAGEDGTPMFPHRTDEDLGAVADLTPAELRAVAEASVPNKDEAKNG